MNRIRIILFALWESLCLVLAVLGAPVVARYVRWDTEPTTFTGGTDQPSWPTIRGDLPSWAWAWDTIDERMPAGMYESTMRQRLERWGPYWCTVSWLIRNRMMGLTAKLFGKPWARDVPVRWDFRHYGPLYFGWGWKKYRATPSADWVDGPFIVMPSVTIRLRSKK